MVSSRPPCPNAPRTPLPTVYTAPPAVSSAVCVAPHATCTTCSPAGRPRTTRGATRYSVGRSSLCPSAPNSLEPCVSGTPAAFNTATCRAPTVTRTPRCVASCSTRVGTVTSPPLPPPPPPPPLPPPSSVGSTWPSSFSPATNTSPPSVTRPTPNAEVDTSMMVRRASLATPAGTQAPSLTGRSSTPYSPSPPIVTTSVRDRHARASSSSSSPLLLPLPPSSRFRRACWPVNATYCVKLLHAAPGAHGINSRPADASPPRPPVAPLIVALVVYVGVSSTSTGRWSLLRKNGGQATCPVAVSVALTPSTNSWSRP